MPSEHRNATAQLALVRRTVARELEPLALPGDDEDLTAAGLVDSMTRVNVLLAIEEAAGVPGFAAGWLDDRPFSVRELSASLLQARTPPADAAVGDQPGADNRQASEVSVVGWAASPGSVVVPAENVDDECKFPPGFLRERTGIESVRRASKDENEIVLAARAAEGTLEMAGLSPADVDLLVAVSTTCLGFPSFAASVHAELLLREAVGAIDVGGACCGVLYALATAAALLSTINGRAALVVASEVNSRRLASLDSPPEFRALFGDAACAFALKRADAGQGVPGRRLREFVWGASSTFASALRVSWPEGGVPQVQFRGEQLAGAAITLLERVIDRLSVMSAVDLPQVNQFALHEPNPRVAAMLAQRAGIPLEKMPQTSRTWGNLGSATCGVNLCKALTATNGAGGGRRPPAILAAAVGPGLLWGGAFIA
ncbi:MAG TPA: 3-oxoacyl-[acyl-carrier-protein] synthase III C-terminal domain-containing protein [Terriglobia bacterium]|nr:3-oxoacyl-[acyl-carrier-protein] synthase III C-terminal domain-containing protein [Terriglobia bacterium]